MLYTASSTGTQDNLSLLQQDEAADGSLQLTLPEVCSPAATALPAPRSPHRAGVLELPFSFL